MPRPSLKEQRTEEILEAFGRCVARYGLDGSTLERIAEEAGMQRPLVRHFAGNREALERQLADKVITLSEQSWREYMACLDDDNRIEWLLEGLFSEQTQSSEFAQVTESLMIAARTRDWLKQKVSHWIVNFEQDLNQLLRREFPRQPQAAIDAVSFGVLSVYLNLDAITPLAELADYRLPGREAAGRLIQTLYS